MSEISHSFIPAADVDQFSVRDKAFMSDPNQFSSFMAYPNTTSSFEQAAMAKQAGYLMTTRSLMAEVLSEQFVALSVDASQSKANLKTLQSEQTFAIITAHQPCLFSGPMYFIYKIASVIKLAQTMSEQFANYHFVPMYVVGSEDHDFEEINHLRLFGKRIEWSTMATGAVGRMILKDIDAAINQVDELLGHGTFKDDVVNQLKAAYRDDRTLAEATAHFVYSLFGAYGIVVADMDDRRLKSASMHLWERELINPIAKVATKKNQEELKDLGFDSQIFARPINLFHLDDSSRSRIEEVNSSYTLGNQIVNKVDLQSYLTNNPERFSPNVVMRPVYQQYILPGVAYVGGGAEVAYWMETKGVFDKMNIPFPMIIRRDSAMWIPQHVTKQMNKTGISVDQLFQPLHEAQTALLQEKFSHDWSLDEYKRTLKDLIEQLTKEVNDIDVGLNGMMKGFDSQQQNFLDKLENKLRKSLKSQHEVSMKRMERIWNDLFPDNSLQERKHNFLAIYSHIGPAFIASLIDQFDPLKPGMHVFQEQI